MMERLSLSLEESLTENESVDNCTTSLTSIIERAKPSSRPTNDRKTNDNCGKHKTMTMINNGSIRSFQQIVTNERGPNADRSTMSTGGMQLESTQDNDRQDRTFRQSIVFVRSSSRHQLRKTSALNALRHIFRVRIQQIFTKKTRKQSLLDIRSERQQFGRRRVFLIALTLVGSF